MFERFFCMRVGNMSKNNRVTLFFVIFFAAILPGCRKQPQTANEAKAPKRKHKAFRDLTYEELKENKNRLVKEGRKETAIRHIEKMMPMCNDIQELRDMTLEIADLLFDSGDLKKAEQLYTQFTQLYPGDKNIEYASYKAILCSFWKTLDAQRDQTKTRHTIELAEKFLERSTIFTKHSPEVSKILVNCKNKLFESEVNIFRFYLDRGDFTSAKNRLENIEKEFQGALTEAEPQIILMACDLATKINDEELLQEKTDELKLKFPNYEETIKIVKSEKKATFLDKF